MDMNNLTNRLMRVLRFDASVYREVAADQGAMGQAALIVIVAAILSALGGLFTFEEVTAGIVFAVIAIVASVVGFAIYAAVATFVAKTFFQGKTEFQEMGRTLGFAYAWYGIGILGLVPFVGGFVAWLGQIVAAIAGVIALRESAEFDTTKAVITVVIAAIVAGLINFCATAIVATPILVAMGLVTGNQ
jgi:hypothetical protein